MTDYQVDPAHRYVAFELGEYWTVLDRETSTYVRNWAKGLTRSVWRSDLETATEMADTMNHLRMGNVRPIAQELHPTQKRMFSARSQRMSQRRNDSHKPVNPFVKCEECGRMVKQGHECSGGENVRTT